ncbi:MAG: hypothetical protein J7K34_00010 [Flavobacteriaceae bacterium]|nr:hypothetical protein [Flavobacteriaceae bacterium]
MNLIEFTNCVQAPGKITLDQTIKLEGILLEYPYFQAAHFLYLNGLKNKNSFKYNNILKKTAAYTTDRTVLFDYISSKYFTFFENEDPKDIKIKDLEVVEHSTPNKTKTKDVSPLKSEIDKLPIGKPLQFNTNETFSFNQWLKITSAKPILREENQKSSAKSNQKDIKKPIHSGKSNFDLIDKFISLNKTLKPSISEYNDDISRESVLENENLMTETLAHVYLEQKKYQKAITAFTILSLKYPEKSSFFANQIKAIKKIQNK